MEDEELLFEEETSEDIQQISVEDELESSEEEENTEPTELGDDLTIDYERLESAMLEDEFTFDSDLNDLFLTDALLLFIVFILVVVFASKEG